MEKKISILKFSVVDGKKTAKSVSFKMDVNKMLRYDSEDAVKRQIRDYAEGLKLMSAADLAEAKFDWREFFEAWREAKIDAEKASEKYLTRVTPANITALRQHDVFVFGSNVLGQHGGGAARYAYEHFGAEWGNGEGMQGQAYAIPSMEGLASLQAAVARFVEYAKAHPSKCFLVTPIGCGIAGYVPKQIAPMFHPCMELENVYLPSAFWNELGILI